MPNATGLIIAGQHVLVPGRTVVNFLDDPKIKLTIPEDGRDRDRHDRVQLVVLHTTKGIPGGSDKRPQVIRPGLGPDIGAEARVARFWSTSQIQSGAHLVVDFDGSIGCLADLQTTCAYHARYMNQRSIGIEIYQGSDAELYLGQLEAVADLVDVLTAHFGIQRQMPDKYRGHPAPRLAGGGGDCWGVVGHRDGDNNRGLGDPGDAVFSVLERRGYERFNFENSDDRAVWRQRQRYLNDKHKSALAVDGIPGPATVAALKAAGYEHGLWVGASASS